MNTYIVIQMQVDSEEQQKIEMSNVVRKVEAEIQELAIGKFVVNTQDIKAERRLKIECYDITELKSL